MFRVYSTLLKFLVGHTAISLSRHPLRGPSRLPPVSRFALSLTFIRPFICMNSNYAERLSAGSAQTRILLPLEDEINAGPINSTLPSSLPLPSPVLPRSSPSTHPATGPIHPRRMILLDYTITADRLCLTFGSGRKMRFPIADVVGFMLRPRRYLVPESVLPWIRLPIITSAPFVSQTTRAFSTRWSSIHVHRDTFSIRWRTFNIRIFPVNIISKE